MYIMIFWKGYAKSGFKIFACPLCFPLSPAKGRPMGIAIAQYRGWEAHPRAYYNIPHRDVIVAR